MRRREFLRHAGTLALGSALPSLGCDAGVPPYLEPDGWDAGAVRHLLPLADHERIRLKASFRAPLDAAPSLAADGHRAEGVRGDGAGRFWAFDLRGLAAGHRYTLALHDASGVPLCDPWPLSTAPAPDALPERARLLVYTCAGGADYLRVPLRGPMFVPREARRRLFARALEFEPDLAVAIGDHVYWDLRTISSWIMGRAPQARWHAGRFDRTAPVLGGANEEVLVALADEQIADLYGTLFRSLPVLFERDDHDYSENDHASEALRTFPPDAFMRDFARATQRLYYPELFAGPDQPRHTRSGDGLGEAFGAHRHGRLLELLLYDCRSELAAAADPRPGVRHRGFLSPPVEAWLTRRARTSDALHLAQVPSTPILYTAGKWAEWYPDAPSDSSAQGNAAEKAAWWDEAWFAQHQRLLAASIERTDRTPLFLCGDIHSTALATMTRSGPLSLAQNPALSLLSGTPGADGVQWPSSARGRLAGPSASLDAETWQPVLEENGFSLVDVTPEQLEIALFRWQPEQGVEAIGSLEPFARFQLPRARGGRS